MSAISAELIMLRSKAEAWEAVVEVLDEFYPDRRWWRNGESLLSAAVETIQRLAEGLPGVPLTRG